MKTQFSPRLTVLPMIARVSLALCIALGVLGTPALPARADGWIIEYPDFLDFDWFTNRGFALDASNRPHFVYGKSRLFYTYYDGSAWQYEIADQTMEVGSHAALDLAGNYPHISYYDIKNGNLKYAYKDGTGWHVETVDSAGDVGKYTSIALDGSNRPHISYFDVTRNKIKYAYKDAAGWHVQTVDDAHNQCYATSIALDSSGLPHISYCDSSGMVLKYARKVAAGYWTADGLPSTVGGMWSSIALDSNNNPHISHYDLFNYDLKYTYKDGSGWHSETPDSLSGYSDTTGKYTSIALDSSGYPHISSQGWTLRVLRYAYKDASGWHAETANSNMPSGTSIALDTNNRPHIGSSPVDEIWYSYKNGTRTNQVVDEFVGRGEYCSLALGSAHISYYEGHADSGGNLRYAYRDASGWRPETVEKGGNVGRYSSLALAGNGYPHIGYSEFSTAPIPAPLGIKYAYKDVSGWHIESVESCECLSKVSRFVNS